MRQLLLLVFWALCSPSLSQFIPQPMGYNPDSNGDEFIGVDDLTGMLALFGNTFLTSDSLGSMVFDWEENQNDTLLIPEDVSILYLQDTDPYLDVTQSEFPRYRHACLPTGTSWKALIVFYDYTIQWETFDDYASSNSENTSFIEYKILHERMAGPYWEPLGIQWVELSKQYCFGGTSECGYNIFLRDQFGRWHKM